MGHAALKFLGDGGKLGQDDPDVRAQGFELLGQGADHIRQAAGFNKGYALAGGDQYPQGRGAGCSNAGFCSITLVSSMIFSGFSGCSGVLRAAP